MDFDSIRSGLSGGLDSVQETAVENSYDFATEYGFELTSYAADGTTEAAGPGFTAGLAGLALGSAALLALKRGRSDESQEYEQAELDDYRD